jgi:hypothetical protein
MLPSIPDISITAMPLDVYRVSYLLFEGRVAETNKYVERAIKTNPHIHVGDYLNAKIQLYLNNTDSAYFYSKRAFFGWPKNLDHYNVYLDVLDVKKDTQSLIQAYNSLDTTLKKRPAYFNRFYTSFNKMKLSYLVKDYPDAINLNDFVLKGNWIRAFNFPNNQVIRDSSDTYTFIAGKLFNNDGLEFAYKIKQDSLFFYFSNNFNKPISSFKARYSEEYETLIFENVPLEDNMIQTQYYRKAN